MPRTPHGDSGLESWRRRSQLTKKKRDFSCQTLWSRTFRRLSVEDSTLYLRILVTQWQLSGTCVVCIAWKKRQNHVRMNSETKSERLLRELWREKQGWICEQYTLHSTCRAARHDHANTRGSSASCIHIWTCVQTSITHSGRTCACAVACLYTHTSIPNVVASVTIHDDQYFYLLFYEIQKKTCNHCGRSQALSTEHHGKCQMFKSFVILGFWWRVTNRTIRWLIPSQCHPRRAGVEQLYQVKRMIGGIGSDISTWANFGTQNWRWHFACSVWCVVRCVCCWCAVCGCWCVCVLVLVLVCHADPFLPTPLSVCTFKTLLPCVHSKRAQCVPAPRPQSVTTCGRGGGTHEWLHGVFSVSHHTARTHHDHNDIHTRHNNNHHNNTRRQGQREKERQRKTDKRTRDKTRKQEKKAREEKKWKIRSRHQEKMKRDRDEKRWKYFPKCLTTHKAARWISPNCFEKIHFGRIVPFFLRKFRTWPFFQLFTRFEFDYSGRGN